MTPSFSGGRSAGPLELWRPKLLVLCERLRSTPTSAPKLVPPMIRLVFRLSA